MGRVLRVFAIPEDDPIFDEPPRSYSPRSGHVSRRLTEASASRQTHRQGLARARRIPARVSPEPSATLGFRVSGTAASAA
jgi:hypothetical protein